MAVKLFSVKISCIFWRSSIGVYGIQGADEKRNLFYQFIRKLNDIIRGIILREYVSINFTRITKLLPNSCNLHSIQTRKRRNSEIFLKMWPNFLQIFDWNIWIASTSHCKHLVCQTNLSDKLVLYSFFFLFLCSACACALDIYFFLRSFYGLKLDALSLTMHFRLSVHKNTPPIPMLQYYKQQGYRIR